MKLRMRGNSVRLRLTRSEVAQFAETGLVEEAVTFPSSTLNYALRCNPSQAVTANLVAGQLTVIVPPALARQWTDTEEIGISAHSSGLDILIEKDFQCAHGPADSDAFPPERLS